jgi:hypothetical protein
VDTRTHALEQIVALASQHGLTAAEIATALGDAEAAAGGGRSRAVLVRVLGYLGGTFVFAGVVIFIALQWDAMSPAARVVITLGSGIAAFTLAVLASRDVRFTRAAAPLFLMAAALEPTGLLVAFDELGSGGDWRWAGLITAGTLAIQLGATYAALGLSVVLFLTVVFATLFWWTGFDLLDMDAGLTAMVIGGSLLLCAIGLDRTRHRSMTAVWYLVGGGLFLYGLFDLVEGTLLELLFLAAASGMVYLSVTVQSRTLLFVATAAVLAYTAWFTGEYFADSIGWPVALVVFGLTMIALSALAFRIDRQYLR